MKKFILLTTSESGDHYHYFIESIQKPTDDDLENFLVDNANDKCGNVNYEYVDEIIEINDDTFFIKI